MSGRNRPQRRRYDARFAKLSPEKQTEHLRIIVAWLIRFVGRQPVGVAGSRRVIKRLQSSQ